MRRTANTIQRRELLGLLLAGLVVGLVVGLTWMASGQTRADEGVEQDGIERDRAALEAIYFALDGPSWVFNSNWLSDRPFNEWYGVLTDDDGRVIALTLYSYNLFGSIPVDGPSLKANELRGRIPPEIGELDRLLGLFLSNNRLSGPIPPELGQLTELRFLRLDGNRLSGPIPAELGRLTNLRSLILMENGLSGPIPPELGTLANLERLFLRSNRLSGPIPPELGQLTNLQYLDLRRTEVSGPIPPQLGELTKLEGLFLGWTGLSGTVPPELGQLSNLRRLSLPADSGLVGPLPDSFTGLTELTSLQLLYTYYDSDSSLTPPCAPTSPAFQAWLGGLEEAGVANCAAPIEDAPLETPTDEPADRISGSPQTDRQALIALYRATNGPNWVNNTNWLSNRPLGEWFGVTTDDDGRVTELKLYTLTESRQVRSNGLRGRIPARLGQLDRLRSLVLWGNSLSGPIPPELGHLSNLEELSLNSNRLSGPIPAELGGMLSLSHLSLDGNRLSGSIPAALGGLDTLQSLDLSRNQLSGPIPTELGGLNRLQYLNLSHNQLSGPIPPKLPELNELSRLYLNNNQLSGPIPAGLGSLYNLTDLFLNDNLLSGSIPAELGHLYRLRELHLGGNEGLTGWLPASLTRLRLSKLQLNDTQLCAHPGATFQAWLSRIHVRRGVENCSVVIEDADRQTLVDFFHATGGPDWLFNTNWLSDRPLGEWYGVSTDGYGRVTGLTHYTVDGDQPIGSRGSELTGNGLSGELPASLGRLDRLEWLYLAGNPDLSGALPDSLVDLEELTGLWFNDTQLCAPAEWEFQAWLRGLEHREGIANCSAVFDLSDREALTALYHSTDGPNWTNNTHWLSERPLDEWHGVTTDEDGRVVALTLYTPDWDQPVDSGQSRGNGLRGHIPGEIGQLDSLQQLDLRNNNLIGPIPPELGDLTELRVLLLALNRLSGPIPSELGELSNLEQLSLGANRLSGPIPPELGNLTDLISLRLDRNKLSGEIPVELGNLSKLERLQLERNRLSGEIPSELGELSRLQRLSLSVNALGGTIPAALGDLTELTVLYLGGNEFSGPLPSELGGLSKLRQPYLSDSPELSELLPASWTGLTSLRLLWVDETPLCAPMDAAFDAWLDGIERSMGLDVCEPAAEELQP